jgi:hypothetical protein
MARKRFVWGKWRVVLENGIIGEPCPVPSEAEQAQAKKQERLAGLELEPLVLKGGEQCPCCGVRLEFVENKRCPSCKNDFYIEVEAAPSSTLSTPVARAVPPLPPPPPGTRVYKVITQRDAYFASKFNPEALEQLLNQHAREGWRVVSVTATDVGSFFGSFWAKGGGSARQELVVLLERDA